VIDLKETLVATAIESFNEGVSTERERIVKILTEYAPHLLTSGLMELIKGEQK
jgi:hypothetical protein